MSESFEEDCGCEWPRGCAGLGCLYCSGCGGDLCVCICGGETECPGCDECQDPVAGDSHCVVCGSPDHHECGDGRSLYVADEQSRGTP